MTRLGLVAAVLVALLTVPVYLTGEPAEHSLRDLVPDVDRDLVHEHDERAEVGFIAVLATGGLAVLALWLGRRAEQPGPMLSGLVLVALVACFGLFAWTALVGGQIRHTELRATPAGLAP